VRLSVRGVRSISDFVWDLPDEDSALCRPDIKPIALRWGFVLSLDVNRGLIDRS
jgi:hypothetical protein